MSNIFKFTADTLARASEVNNNFNKSLRLQLMNLIRMLQDRSVDLTANGREFAEAYIDSSGRLNSVDSVNTDAKYDDVNLVYVPKPDDEASGDTTYDPSAYTNPENAFDGDDGTYAVFSSTSTGSSVLGKTFSAKTVNEVYVKWYIHASDGVAIHPITVKLQTYNGSTWSDHTTLHEYDVVTNTYSASGTNIVYINSSIQGVRVAYTIDTSSPNTFECRLYSLEYGDPVDSVIAHNIPSGSFSSSFIAGFATALIKDWEDGANIQYRLTNGSDDTGYGDIDEVLEAGTTFSTEPTKFYVKLIPKTTSPSNGYPGVLGVGVIE